MSSCAWITTEPVELVISFCEKELFDFLCLGIKMLNMLVATHLTEEVIRKLQS